MEQLAKETQPGLGTWAEVQTKLASIAQRACRDREAKFTSLAHLMNKATLEEAFMRLSGTAAPGIDKETKERYGQNLDENLEDLIKRLKSNSYHPTAVRRKYIPKPGSDKLRPLGIPVLEDKLLQTALVMILENIYEQDFLSMSYGFRPGLSCHDALKELSQKIGTKKVNYIVDADIRGYFDHVDHEWLMKFLQHRISDTKILRLIKRFLKAGVMEDGKHNNTEEGVPQGGSISPLLANIYLHYALDLWFEKVVKVEVKGEAYLIRYADDFIACFQYQETAWRYYRGLQKRLRKFNLEIAEGKTRILEFGRFAARDVKKRGKKKPDTFDFLGFTHYCGKTSRGKFKLKWRTARKKSHAKIQAYAEWIKENRHLPLKEIWQKTNQKLRGHYQYYGVSDNWNGLIAYREQVRRLLYKWLNRRSQRRSFNYQEFCQMIERYPLVRPKSLVDLNCKFV